jgi:hypothetical protein
VPADVQSVPAAVRTGLPALLQPSSVPADVLAVTFTDVRADAVSAAAVLATDAVAAALRGYRCVRQAALGPWTHDTKRTEPQGMSEDWIGWLCELLKAGTDALGVDLAGEPVVGLRQRSVGCPVSTPEGQRWLRVVTEARVWASGPAWTGNVEANGIRGVDKPVVEDVAEWEQAGRQVRAELMTLAPGPRISEEMALRQPVELGGTWWEQLRNSLTELAGHATPRVCLDGQLVHRRLLAAFGVDIDPEQLAWSTAHGDVHWANLTAPRCWLQDWESWGSAPVGYDAALLHATSLLQPKIAARVHSVFGEVLDTHSGQVAQLLAAAKLLGLVEHGDHPQLAIPLHRHARSIVDWLSVRR